MHIRLAFPIADGISNAGLLSVGMYQGVPVSIKDEI